MNEIAQDLNRDQLEGHYKRHVERQYIGSHDLMGPDGEYVKATVTIDGVFARQIYNPGKRETNTCMVVSIKGKDKDFIVNATNQKAIEAIAGTPMTEKWIGVRIGLVVEQVKVGRDTKPALRVKPIEGKK